MKILNDAGNAGIYGGAAAGVGTTAGTMAQWMTTNATVIGLSLTAFSIVVGIIFKIIGKRQDMAQKEKHHKEMLELNAKHQQERTEALVAAQLEVMEKLYRSNPE